MVMDAGTASQALLTAGKPHRFQPGQSGNPAGRAPVTVDGAFRALMREVEFIDGEKPITRAQRLVAKAYERAMDDDRKDSVLWAKLCIERCDGPARADIADALGFGAIAAREHERWARKDDVDVVSPAEFRVTDGD